MAASTHIVAIFHDDREPVNPYRISPSYVMAGEGDRIFFKNMTEIDVLVKFKGNSPFEENEFTLHPHDITNPANNKTVGPVPVGDYKYEAHCDTYEAEGTRPIIIIYDK